jgi:hypothetical protein
VSMFACRNKCTNYCGASLLQEAHVGRVFDQTSTVFCARHVWAEVLIMANSNSGLVHTPSRCCDMMAKLSCRHLLDRLRKKKYKRINIGS